MELILAVFEDTAYRRFLPLAHTRPTYELLCGAMCFRERIERHLAAPARLYCRSYLAPLVSETLDRPVNDLNDFRTPVLWVNGRMLDPASLGEVCAGEAPCTWWNGDQLVAAKLPPDMSRDLALTLESNEFILEAGMIPSVEDQVIAAPLVDYPWELVLNNGGRIAADFEFLGKRTPSASIPTGVHALGGDFMISTAARIDPGAALDARGGPILVGPRAEIAAHTSVEGPAVIGSHTRLVGGKVRSGTTIGPHCRIGGEVEQSIFHGFSNKYHEGFLGHAYVGEWVNLGALTTNSDLKNTYGSVKLWNDGHFMDSGEMKVGALLGDHAKTGIGTLLNTGTVLGVAANIFGGGLVSAKFIPSFTWGQPPGLQLYDPERCLHTIGKVMARRGREPSDAYLDLIEALYELTEGERSFAGMERDVPAYDATE